MPPEDEQHDLGRQFFMESTIVTHATKVAMLVSVNLSSSKSGAKHNA
jgi:hypothetical protein